MGVMRLGAIDDGPGQVGIPVMYCAHISIEMKVPMLTAGVVP
jgi:hypothetical protein